MPYKKKKKGSYESPSGKEMSEDQVKAYYAKKKGGRRAQKPKVQRG